MKERGDIRIAVIRDLNSPINKPIAMNMIRWYKIAEALYRIGYHVELITDDLNFKLFHGSEKLPYKNSKSVNWSDYDVIKVVMHSGFNSYLSAGGKHHPFIITNVGSAVASKNAKGVYFFDHEREKLFEIQNKIFEHSKYISVLTEANKAVLKKEYPRFTNYLDVPTGVDREIPPPKSNPFSKDGSKICVYIGNIYGFGKQDLVNQAWQERLNRIGQKLIEKKIKLYFIGPGDTSRLNKNYVTAFAPVLQDSVWDYQYYADVGLALSHGPVCDNESSKIYNYLRGGLPAVVEDTLPNSELVAQTGYGEIVDYDNIPALIKAVEKWVEIGKGGADKAMQYMITNHSWDQRVKVYDDLFLREFNLAI